MTVRTTTYLKGKFETNDIPTQTDYQDIFDSFVPVGTSGAFSLDQSQTLNNLTLVSALSVGGVTSVQAININGTETLEFSSVSANTTVQATGGLLSHNINYVNYANGQHTSVLIPPLTQGRRQYIVNAASTVLKVFPPSGANFIGTAANASLALPTDKSATILHCVGNNVALIIG